MLKKKIIIICILFLFIAGCFWKEEKPKEPLESYGITGMDIGDIQIETTERTTSYAKTEIKTIEIAKQSIVKQTIDLSAYNHIKSPINVSIKTVIDYDEILWNGTWHKITSEPLVMSSWKDYEGELIIPPIFMDRKYYKRTNYNDLVPFGGYALAYVYNGEYIIEQRVDNTLYRGVIDPTYTNQTGGFDTGVIDALGICAVGRDVLIDSHTDNAVYNYSAGVNQTSYKIDVSGESNQDSYGATCNASTVWIVTRNGHDVFWYDADDGTLIGTFSTDEDGLTASTSIGMNTSNLFIGDDSNDEIYVYDFVGNLQYTFDTSTPGLAKPRGVTAYLDNTTVSDSDDIYAYIFVNGVNQTGDGFSITDVCGLSAVDGIGHNGSSFVIWSNADNFVCYVERLIPNTAPSFTTDPYIDSITGTNITLEDLRCNFVPTDANGGDTLTADLTWFKENVSQIEYTGLSVSIDTLTSFTLKAGNTTTYDNWSCQARMYDQSLYSDWVNSSQLEVILDTTGPNCTLISITPSDIEANSTGLFELIVNCTDPSGINVSKAGDHWQSFYTMTVDSDGSTPNQWSIFYPNNSLAVSNSVILDRILRAVGRNESYWYEDIGQTELDADVYTYAVYDGEYGHFNIQENGSDWALFNMTGQVEEMVFKQARPLNKGKMIAEEKKNYSVYKNNGLMVLFYDLERRKNAENYTLTAFGNFHYSGTPNKDMEIFYCNQSYLDISCGGGFHHRMFNKT